MRAYGLPHIQEDFGKDGERCFQYEGVPAHYHSYVRPYLDENLSRRYVEERGLIKYPARSADLTTMGFSGYNI